MKKSELIQIIKEEINNVLEANILVPRNIEGRKEKRIQLDNQKIQDYIKGGSQGDLDLRNTQITSLPNNLKVGGSLDLYNTPVSKKYSKDEIRKMIEDKGGYVKGKIIM